MAELPKVARPHDVSDETRFRKIARAIASFEALPPERREKLLAEWRS